MMMINLKNLLKIKEINMILQYTLWLTIFMILFSNLRIKNNFKLIKIKLWKLAKIKIPNNYKNFFYYKFQVALKTVRF